MGLEVLSRTKHVASRFTTSTYLFVGASFLTILAISIGAALGRNSLYHDFYSSAAHPKKARAISGRVSPDTDTSIDKILNWKTYRETFVTGSGDSRNLRDGKRVAFNQPELREMMFESADKAYQWEKKEPGKLRKALATGRVGVVRGVSTDRLLVPKFGYEKLKAGDVVSDGDKAVCFDGEIGLVPNSSFGHPPRSPCVGIVTNAILAGSGTAISIQSDTLYEVSGGCCSQLDWRPLDLKSDQHKTLEFGLGGGQNGVHGLGKRLVVNLRHHHDVTYSHVLSETLPRYLSMAPLLDAVPEAMVAIGDSDLAEYLLCKLGLERKRLIRLEKPTKAWVYASVAILPPATQDPFYYPSNVFSTAVSSILRAAALEESEKRLNDSSINNDAKANEKPLLVLLERGFNRNPTTGACVQQRCAKNFGALYQGLASTLGQKYQIEIYPADGNIGTAVRTFSTAAMVVGVHGGGFKNLIFCKKGTAVVHIGWGNHYKKEADLYGLNYHLINMKGLSRGSKNIMLDVPTIVSKVQAASAP